ncbi:apolipoprotein N-acyltransferase [bacterium NHP-B]|nr:apolipoprotein N-acyltransferase [bacterium NHP-B]
MSLLTLSSFHMKISLFMAVVLGAFSACALPPLYFWPFLSIGMLGLFKMLEPLPLIKGLCVFFAWCFGFFLVGFYWITLSMYVELDKFWFLIPFCFVIIPIVFACIHVGLLAAILSFFSISNFGTLAAFLSFILSWSLAEWVRGSLVFGGIPWNFFAHIWGENLFIMQTVSVIGSYGLSVLTLFFLSIPYLWAAKTLSFRVRLSFTGALTFIIFVISFWGHQRMKPLTYHAKPWIRLVQPNISQKDKMNPDKTSSILTTLTTLTQLPSKKPLTHILWPEAAFPFWCEGSQKIGVPLPIRFPQTLITGVMRRERHKLHNSLVVVRHNGELTHIYDKYHLVPFGEYIPGRHWLPLGHIKALTLDRHDFTPGPHIKTFYTGNLPPFSPLICFDTAFSNHVAQTLKRPHWLLELTNNAWFGESWGLYQHLDIGRLRAIEEGVPLVRVTNTGISCLVSPYGQVLKQLPISSQGVIDFALPKPLEPTLFQTLGYTCFWLSCALLFLTILWQTTPITKKRRRLRKKIS